MKAAEYVDEQADKCLVVEDAKAGLQAAIAGEWIVLLSGMQLQADLEPIICLHLQIF